MIHPLTFLKGAGLGAGMMYFFDPVAGNRRRDRIRDQFADACSVCNEAGDRLLGASKEVRGALEASDQPLAERVQEGVMGAGRALGMEWSPTAKAAVMIGGAGLVASLMNKRDLAALAFGIVGLSFVAKELANQEQLGQSPRGNGPRQSGERQNAEKRPSEAKAKT